MSFRADPDDARRGGLVILGASAAQAEVLARRFAEGGYETVTGGSFDELSRGLAAPLFLLALPEAATTAWTTEKVAAMSIVADSRIGSCVERAPAARAILHLDPTAHLELALAFEAAQPDLPVHIHPKTEEGERLMLLRTLRLFASAGGRGEV